MIASASGIVALLAPQGASAGTTWVTAGSFGSSGSGASGLSNPRGIGIEEPTGAGYVADANNHRVVKYSSGGGFLLTFGDSVNQTTGGDLCAALSGDTCQAGADGTSAGQFSAPEFVAVDNSAGPSAGDLYIADLASNTVSKYDSSGGLVTTWGDGGQISGPADPDNPGTRVPFEAPIVGIAADAAGDLLVGLKTFPLAVHEFFEDGNDKTAFSGPRGSAQAGLAVDASGNIFKANGSQTIEKLLAAGSDIGELTGHPEDPGVSDSASGLAVDPSTGDLYSNVANGGTGVQEVVHYHFNGNGEAVQPDGTTCAPTPNSSGGPCGPIERIAAGAVTAGPGIAYHSGTAELQVASASSDRIDFFARRVVPTATTGSAASVGTTTATLSGTVNPEGVQVTDCRFEYDTDLDPSDGQTAPCVETVGAGTSDLAVHADISGLSPARSYYFRLVAENADGADAGVVHSFNTPDKPAISATEPTRISASDAYATALINANFAATTFHVEFGPTAEYGSSTPESASVGSDSSDHSVSQAMIGLQPGTTYHFRIVAHNLAGTTTGSDSTFRTFARAAVEQDCPNAELRAQNGSLDLPDCRAYELVSPSNASGLNVEAGTSTYGGGDSAEAPGLIDTPQVSETGDAAIFSTAPGLPGTHGNGQATQYKATRSADGWTTELFQPDATQSSLPFAGGSSPDLRYTTTFVQDQVTSLVAGTLARPYIEDNERLFAPTYLVGPDGSIEPIGTGSLGVAYAAPARLITSDGSRIVFSAAKKLEPNAPADGTVAVYGRSVDGPTQVLSLLPGNAPPGGDAFLEAASADGTTVAFSVHDVQANETALYVRRDGATQLVASHGGTAPPQPVGIARDGSRLYYLNDLDQLFTFDAASGLTHQITTEQATPVQVSDDGARIYFLSHAQLDGSKGSAGAWNLYGWDGAIRFIAEVSNADVGDSFSFRGLSMWTNAWRTFAGANSEIAPARATPNGTTLIFESDRNQTAYDSHGQIEIYRYDAASALIMCISCIPTGEAPNSGAHLTLGDPNLSNPGDHGPWVRRNISADGRTVYFQTADRLAVNDVNNQVDVYQWRGGRLTLISSGRSREPSLLYAMTADGSDVLFTTWDALIASDQNSGSRVIYDARVGGGFSQLTAKGICHDESCQGSATPAPDAPVIATVTFPATYRETSPGARLGHVKVLTRRVRGGRFALSVTVPGPGSVTLTGARTETARAKARRAGTIRITTRLTATARRALARKRRLDVVVRVSYRTASGETRTARARLHVRARRTAHHARTHAGLSELANGENRR